MTAYVLGPNSDADRSVVGVFDVSDANLDVVGTGVLRAGDLTEVDLPVPGVYLVRGFVLGGKQLSAVLQVDGTSDETRIAHLQFPGAATELKQPASGWIAVWRPNPSFEPVDGEVLRTSGNGLTVEYTAAAGENVILQWAIGDGLARCTVAPTGAAVRFVDGRQLEPASDEAHVLLGFLDEGDPVHAAVLAEATLQFLPYDPTLAAAAGYYLLSAGDPRLQDWSRQMIERWPRLFDAHLLHGWACLYSANSWQQAGAALRNATRCGLPLAARGLRLLDDALRLVAAVMDQDPETAREQFLPYLRAADDPGLTSFTGSPEYPGATTALQAPPHARTWYQSDGRLRLAGPVRSDIHPHSPAADPGPRRFAAPLVLAGARGTGGRSTADMIVLDLPAEAREILGSAVTARVLPEHDSLGILLAPVPDLPIMVAIDEAGEDWHTAERPGNGIAYVRIPWTGSGTPRAVHIAVGDTPPPAAENPLDALRTRLRKFSQSLDFALVLDPVAVQEAEASLAAAREPSGTESASVLAQHTAGWLHWYRFLASENTDMSALYLAVELFAMVARERIDAVPEELRDTVAVDGPPASASPADRAAWQLRVALSISDIHALNEAIEVLRETAGDRPEHLANLAAGLGMRFERQGDRHDLDEAISLMREVVRRTPRKDPRLVGTLSNLGAALRTLADLTGDDSTLNEAVSIAREAVEAAPNGDPYLAGHLSNLAAALQQRHSHRGDLADADAAIEAGSRALAYAAADDPGRPLMWNNLALALRSRFEQTGNLGDLDRAVEASRDAVASTEPGHPNRAAALSNLAVAARLRFEHRGEVADADAAIEAAREAADLLEEASPARVAVLTNLCTALRTRHRHDPDSGRFDEAVGVAMAAVEITTRSDGPAREAGPALTALLSSLVARYEVTGDLADLDNAVIAARTAVIAPSRTSGDQAARLGNLSDVLRLRYSRRGVPADLDEAIEYAEAAVSRTPERDPMRGARLTALSNVLTMRAARTLAVSDLERAVTTARAAAESLPSHHPDQTAAQSNLGVALRMRFAVSRDPADLDEAITAGRRAAALPEPQRFLPSQANLATALRLRSETTGREADLEEAVDLCRAILDRLPNDHPSRSPIFASLGNCMMLRYERSGVVPDLAAAVDAWWRAGQVSTAPAATRFEALRALATNAAGRGDWGWAIKAYTEATSLIPVLAWHGVDRAGREDLLNATVDIATDAVAAHLAASTAAEETVVLLDNSRAVMWGQILDVRTDLNSLRAEHPHLVARLESARSQLERPTDVTESITLRIDYPHPDDRRKKARTGLDNPADV
ncbi:tetratricopeptide repeat protein [Actinoplanes sp. NPDC048988]|uniref:tetratricopeptide repeat protein n=1 Tax=Actinoplanes sp. NPDC048988 TaxID=3363901 RepID=UPI003713FAC7